MPETVEDRLAVAEKLVSGLSNISICLPERRVLNRAFMTMSVAMGMDAFILDPLDQTMMSLLAASRALAGQDGYCISPDILEERQEGPAVLPASARSG
ncbi:MAG: hypothetical protein ACYCVD_18020 [Desulfitobacteriaceae bacterium]